MTYSGIPQYPQTDLFDERIEILSKELELAIQWNRSSALLVVYNSEYIRVDVETALENFLTEQGQKIVRVQMDDMSNTNFISSLQEFPDSTDRVFFINGSQAEDANIFTKLGNHQDILINKNIRAVIWLTQNNITDLAHLAPDLWEYRQRVIEFVDSPKPETVLQNEIESAWQGTGEYTDHCEDTEEKISLRENLLTELPENEKSTSTRANLLLTLGILNWRKGDFEKANDLLENAIKAAIRLEDNWLEAECFNAMALVKFSQGKNDDAIEAYKQAIAIAPDQIFVWNNLGKLCMKIMRNDEAMLAFQKSLEHNHKDPIAWNGLGTVYYRIGYLDDAITAYRKAIEYAPTLAHPWVGLGDTYGSMGRDMDAIAAYQKALGINKQYITPWLRLADIYCKQGRNRDAIKTFQRALLVDPKNHQVWNELGSIFLKINSVEEAIQAFSKARELDHTFGWPYSNLALAYANQGKYNEAIELCQKSLQVFTEECDQAISWDRLGNFYRAINDYDNAVKAYQMADKLNGHIVTAPHELASDTLQPLSVQGAETALPAEATRRVSLIKKENELLATVEEAQLTTTNKPEKDQSTPAWIFQSDSWNQSNTVLTTCSENFFRKEEPVGYQFDEKSVAKKSMEELPMPTPASVLSHPMSDVISTTEFSESQIPTDLFNNEEEMAETKNPAVWNEMGNIHFQNGAYDDAISAYNKAIELDYSFGWPYSNLALTYLTLGKYAESILLYQRSASLLNEAKEKAASWNSLGNIYHHLNDYENALNAYQKADELDPQNSGRREKVDPGYSEPNSHNAQVWLELGNLFFRDASYNEAVNSYAKAVKIDSTSGWAHSNLAMSLVFQGKLKEAIPVYLKSIELFSNDKDKAVSWNRLGTVYRKMNDHDNALEAHQKAVKLSNEKENLLTRTRFSLLSNCYAS